MEEFRIDGEETKEQRNKRVFRATNTLSMGAMYFNEAGRNLTKFSEMDLPNLNDEEKEDLEKQVLQVMYHMTKIHKIVDKSLRRFAEENEIPLSTESFYEEE